MSDSVFGQQGQHVHDQRNVYAAPGSTVHVHAASTDGHRPTPSLSPTVPARNPLFTGREDELADIHAKLAGGVAALTSGVAALHGLGGEGKTSTAVEYAYRHAADYDRVFMVRAEREGEFEAQIAGLAAELGLPEAAATEQDVQFKAVTRWFASTSNWLLIIDNAEGLPELRPKLPRHTQGRVLVTTRETITPRFGPTVEIRHLDDAAGALLLLRCAGLTRPESALTEGETLVKSLVVDAAAFADAQRVSAALGGLALALDHAGTYMARRKLTPAAYFDQFEKYRTKLFERGENPDHDTVTVTFMMALEQVEAIPEYGPSAAQLIRLCAFLAPEAIPDEMFRTSRLQQQAMNLSASKDLDWYNVIEAATRFALLRRETSPLSFTLHRLVARVIRDSMSDVQSVSLASQAISLIAINFPDASQDNWSLCTQMLPHVLAATNSVDSKHLELPQTSRALNQASYYLWQIGRTSEAIPLLRRSLDIRRTINPGGPKRLGPAINNLAMALRSVGQSEEALSLFLEHREIYESAGRTNDPDYATTLDNLGGVYEDLGNYGEAEALRRQAYDVTCELRGPIHPQTALRLNNWGSSLQRLQRFEEAEKYLKRAIEINEAQPTREPLDRANDLANLAGLYVSWERPSLAKEPLELARSIRDELLPEGHPNRIHCCLLLSQLHFLEGNLPSAYLEAKSAHKVAFVSPSRDHPNTQELSHWLQYLETLIESDRPQET